MKIVKIAALVVLFGLLIATAIPNFISMREHRVANACVNNLRWIQTCKAQWGAEHKMDSSAVPTITDLTPYLPGAEKLFPTCPSGGVYTIGSLAQPPMCSEGKPDHALPDAHRP